MPGTGFPQPLADAVMPRLLQRNPQQAGHRADGPPGVGTCREPPPGQGPAPSPSGGLAAQRARRQHHCRADSRRDQVHRIVQPRRCLAQVFVPAAVPDHAVQRVHGAEGESAGQSQQGKGQPGADVAVGRVFRHRFYRRRRSQGLVEGVGIPADQASQFVSGLAHASLAHGILNGLSCLRQSLDREGGAQQRCGSYQVRYGPQFPQPVGGQPGQPPGQRGHEYGHEPAPGQRRRLRFCRGPHPFQQRYQLAHPNNWMKVAGQLPQQQVQRQRDQQRACVKIPLSGPYSPFHRAALSPPCYSPSPLRERAGVRVKSSASDKQTTSRHSHHHHTR